MDERSISPQELGQKATKLLGGVLVIGLLPGIIGVFLGLKVDEFFNSAPWGLITCLTISFAFSVSVTLRLAASLKSSARPKKS